MAWKLHAIEQMQLRGRRRVDSVGRPKFDFHTASRQHWGIENHLRGSAALTSPVAKFVKFKTIRASEGVISGRSDSRRPERSSIEYSCAVTSSPALRMYSSSDSSTGASYSSKPCSAATSRHWPKSQVRSAMSSG